MANVGPVRVRYGVFDNNETFAQWLAANPIFQTHFIGTVNLNPLVPPFTNVYVPSMTYLACVGKILLNRRQVTAGDCFVATLGELMAPDLPVDQIKNQNEARAYLVRVVTELLNFDQLEAYTTMTRQMYLRDIADRDSDLRRAGGQGLQEGAVLDWPDDNVPPSPQAAVRILLAFAIYSSGVSKVTGTQLIVTALSAISRRGHITERFADKIRDGLRADINVSVTIDPTRCSTFYSVYGAYINDENIQVISQHWAEIIPQQALRLALTVQQLSGSGLTTYITIGRAMKLYRDFPWASVRVYIPDDFTNYQTAVRAVGNNVYYGFRKDLGPARSTRFKNLGYVAKELLVKVGGETALNQYMGWKGRVPNKGAIDLLIAEYEARRNAEPTAAEVQQAEVAMQGLVDLIDEDGMEDIFQ